MNQTVLDAVELSLIPNLGNLGQSRLWSAVDSSAELFRMTLSELQAHGASSDAGQAIRARRYGPVAQRILEEGRKQGWHFLVLGEPGYPALLRDIYDPPLVLYARGALESLEKPAVALVGTRRPTWYGLQMAQGLAADLAERGVTIVSGMARGIDAAAHRGCLESHGSTLAVFGCGLDVIYPREHRRLSEQIAQRGLLLSEFAPGTAPSPPNFPVRNRVISGLSLGTVIVEASEYSGSLITARVAMEQNREVFAVPGNITSPQSFGPNFLIKQGAKLVQSWRDVVEELPAGVRHPILVREVVKPAGTPELEMLSDDESRVLGALSTDGAMPFDRVLLETRLEISRLSSLLFHLEIRGWIRQLPGNLYVKLAKPPK